MCGHVGVYFEDKIPLYGKEVFNALLYVDALRGWDATGVAAVSTSADRAVRISKAADPSPVFCKYEDYLALLKQDSLVLLGHNRAATKGTIIDRNSHPFRHGHITMAHNGSLWTWDELTPGKSFKVDSEAIAYALSTTDTKTVLEKINGAFALVWYDQREHSLNFARNIERPMYIAISEKLKGIVWASEYKMLDWILTREKLDKDFSIKELEPLNHAKFMLGKPDVANYNVEEFEDTSWNGYYANYKGGYPALATYDYQYGYSNNTPKHTNSSFRSNADELRNLGVTKGEKILFTYADFKPYTVSKEGTLYGIPEKVEHDFIVTAYSMPNSLVKDDIIYKGEVSHFLPYSAIDGSIPSVVVRNVSVYLDNVVELRGTAPIKAISKKEEDEEELILIQGVYMEYKRWQELTKYGCSNCQSNIYDSDADKVMIYSDNQTILCPECARALEEELSGVEEDEKNTFYSG